MGAAQFTEVSHGASAAEAFNRAKEAAYWEHGHGGYTGTIAEKPGFVTIKNHFAAGGVSAEKLAEKIASADMHVNSTFGGREGQAAYLSLVKKYGRQVANEIVEVYTDKWGPCVAIPVTGKMEADYRKANDLVGKQTQVWLFCGWASE